MWGMGTSKGSCVFPNLSRKGTGMYLRVKDWALLASPLALAVAIGAGSGFFVDFFEVFLPEYRLYRNIDFEQRVKVYARIVKKRKAFDEIRKKVKLRPEKSQWLIEHCLYAPKGPEIPLRSAPVAKKHPPRLKLVIPGNGYAVIDAQIYKIGEKVDGFKIVKITNLTFKLKKGKVVKWLELFK